MLKQHGRISVCLLAFKRCPNNTLWVHLLYYIKIKLSPNSGAATSGAIGRQPLKFGVRVRHKNCHIEPRAFRDCVTWPRARSRKHAFRARGGSRDDLCAKQIGMPARNPHARRWRQQCPVRTDAFGPGLSSTLHANHPGSLFLTPRPLIKATFPKSNRSCQLFAMATMPKTRDTHAVRTRRVPVRLCSWPSWTAWHRGHVKGGLPRAA